MLDNFNVLDTESLIQKYNKDLLYWMSHSQKGARKQRSLLENKKWIVEKWLPKENTEQPRSSLGAVLFQNLQNIEGTKPHSLFLSLSFSEYRLLPEEWDEIM